MTTDEKKNGVSATDTLYKADLERRKTVKQSRNGIF
jgi:hypothetical protein